MLRLSTFVTICSITALVIIGSVIIQRCNPNPIKNKEVSKGNNINQFIGDQGCKGCHANENHDWLQSHHYMAMLPPNDSTVKGDFNNVSFTGDGVTSRFFKTNGKYYINTEGEDGKNHDYEVKYIFGFTPLQQYLIEFPGGRMQVPRVSWDVKKKKWFNQYSGQKIASHDWLHWTGNAQNWNTMCASCHSTNLQKNYDIATDNYKTSYSSINVSCESCHGAGKMHADYINGSDYKNNEKTPGSYIQLARNASQAEQINSCAPCHALKSDLNAVLLKSDELMDNYIPQIPDTENFFADGQVDDEDYIYTSFLQSKMFRQGVKCSNCHNPHTTKTLAISSNTCLSCHAKTYNEPSHTFHPAATVGIDCQSCHMPGKLYMGNDLRHDHSFRVPRPDLTVKYGTPNACGNCHKNKSAQWASDAVNKWYGPTRKYHYSEDLIPGSKLDENSEAHLLKLLSDTSVPDIIKATSAFYLGNITTQNSLQALIKCLSEKDPQIRYRALKSLASFEPATWQNAAVPLLEDKVRAVRIAAADLYLTVPKQQIPEQYISAYNSSLKELQNYLFYQADFPVGNLMIADYYLRQNDLNNAEKFYVRGLKKDSLMNYARLNLSSVYNSQGKNKQALAELQTALKIDPKNDRIHYNLALLYNELNDKTAAENSFAKAVELKTGNTQVYYNYGLLLNEAKKYKEAEIILQKGIAINATSPELYYALSFVYIQKNDLGKARQTALKLKQLAGGNPEYQQLFKGLGI